MKWSGTNKDYYESRGYVFTYFWDEFTVKLDDLNPKSKKLVKCKCDFCGKEVEKKFCDANKNDTHACSSKKCIKKLREYTNIKIYGVPYPLSLKEIQEKGEATMMQKYGCRRALQNPEFVEKERATHKKHFGKEENPEAYEDLQNKLKAARKKNSGYEYALQNPETQKRMRERNLELYSVPHHSQRPEVREKISKTHKAFSEEKLKEINQKRRVTCLKRYNAEIASQNQEVRDKMSSSMTKTIQEHPELIENRKKVMKEKYGVECFAQDPEKMKEIKRKANITMNKNQTAPTSQNQIRINNLVHGCLNYPLDNLLLDIVLIDDMIAIEYDGGGHDLLVKMHKLTKEEFETKERKRELFIYSKGFKIIRVISRRDKLFCDDKLLNLINTCRDYLNTMNHHWIHLDIDNLKIESVGLNLNLDKDGNIKKAGIDFSLL